MSKIAQIKIGADYFKTTVKNESIYPLAWRWTKEVLQNSVDAGATAITFNVYDDVGLVEVIDNAGGMDEDTLVDVFLSLGGSKKDADSNTVGGFGDAKKIICFCWDLWSIETKDNFLTQDMIGRSVEKLKHPINGTKISVVMGSEYSPEEMIRYLNFCQLDVKINFFRYKNAGAIPEKVEIEKLYKRRLTQELPFGKLYINKTQKSERLYVRVNGLLLFERYLLDCPATCILELENLTDPKSNEYMLNVTRENLRYKYMDVLESLIYELTVSPSKIDKKPECPVEIMNGVGSVPSFINRTCDTECEVISDNTIEKIDVVSMTKYLKDNPKPTNESDSVFKDVYPYDFIIRGKTNIKYDSFKYKKILLAWHKAIQYVMYYNYINDVDVYTGSFRIGFTFEDNVLASYNKIGDDVSLLINPTDLAFSVYGKKGMVLEIIDRACHELCHYKFIEHNENFVIYNAKVKRICNWYIDDIIRVISGILNSSESDLLEVADLNEKFEY